MALAHKLNICSPLNEISTVWGCMGSDQDSIAVDDGICGKALGVPIPFWPPSTKFIAFRPIVWVFS